MTDPVKVGSPEFEALKRHWYARAAAGPDGVDDIEAPPPCRPGVDPRRHAAYFHDYIRPDNPSGYHLPLGDLLASEDSEIAPVLKRDPMPLWHSPVDYLAEALNRFTFKNRKDKAIAGRLHKGETWKHISNRLHVGEHRIQRVIRDVRRWLAAR